MTDHETLGKRIAAAIGDAKKTVTLDEVLLVKKNISALTSELLHGDYTDDQWYELKRSLMDVLTEARDAAYRAERRERQQQSAENAQELEQSQVRKSAFAREYEGMQMEMGR